MSAVVRSPPRQPSQPRAPIQPRTPSQLREPGVTRLLITAVFSIVLPTLALGAVAFVHLWQRGMQDVEKELLYRARSLAGVIQRDIAQAEAGLQALSTSPSLGAGDLRSFHRQLRTMEATHGTRFLLVDENGDKLVHSRFEFGEPLGARGDPSLTKRVFETATRQVSDVHVGKTSKEPRVSVEIPVRIAGQVAYGLNAALPAARFEHLLHEQRPPGQGWLLAILDARAHFIARSQEHAKFVGLPGTPMARDFVRSGEPERVARSSGASGIPTRVAWVRVEGTPWSVAVGRYESSLMQAHWVHLAWIGASAFTLLAIGTAVAYAQAGRIRRAVRSLAEMAAAAGTGTTRLPPAGRLGVEEFSAVQAALGASVERLNKRSAERDAAEAKLREADQRKDEFLAMLAHELRNPLAPVLNGVRLLLRREPLDESGRRVVEMVERQTLHMKRLVDDLLEVSRITRGQIDLRREPMELNATIEQVIDVVRPGFEAKGVTLSTALPATPVHIVADPVRLQQILENLLSNAGKFTPRGGTVRIEAAMLGDMAEVRVIDDGAGIAEEKLDRIFELFQQADPSFDRAEGGLGIGLAMVRRLAKLHGGSVQAESAGRGQGATFVLRLPCSGDRRRAARGAGEGGELAAEPGSPDQRA